MKVVIVGCGRVGHLLTELLVKGGHDVTIIDLDRGALAKLSQPFKGTTLQGNGTDLDTLRQAGIDKADAFLSLTQGDNRNLMAAQIAKLIFGVKTVIAKVNDPIRANTYRAQGIGTFSRTSILATLLEATLMRDPEVGKVLMEKSRALEGELAETGR
jgi:trk system potassium uptake protein TrkA